MKQKCSTTPCGNLKAVASHLTAKQQAFCREFVKTGRVSDSYRAAYSVAPNRSAKSVSRDAAILLSDPRISQEIERIRLTAGARAEVTVDRVIREYAKLAFVDIRQAFDEAGNLKAVKDLPDEVAAAIAGIEFEELWEGRGEDRTVIGRLAKIKLSDKRAALDSLAKTLGMFIEPQQATASTTIQLVVLQAGQAIPEGAKTLDIRALIKQ